MKPRSNSREWPFWYVGTNRRDAPKGSSDRAAVSSFISDASRKSSRFKADSRWLHAQDGALDKIALIQGEQFSPRSLGSRLVVDLAAPHRPAVIAAFVYFHCGFEMSCCESL